MSDQFEEIVEDIFDDQDVNIDNYYLILIIQNQKYAIPIKSIFQFVQINEITHLPDAAQFVKGLINVNGQNIKIIDARTKLGLVDQNSELDQLIETLKLREQNHRNWLAELERSVVEKREFKLTTDPHACKFGVWYDNFTTTNQTLATFLERFDQPHKEFHEVAIRVNEKTKKGLHEEALAIVHRAKNKEFKRMIDLFTRLYIVIKESNREVAILVDKGEKKLGLNVDNIDKINYFELDQISFSKESEFIDGNIILNDETILIMNEGIFNE